MKKFEERGQGGFTLIELLVVIAILGILAGVVVFAVGQSTNNAKTAACKTELASAKTGVAAADVANEVNAVGSEESPDDYLENSEDFSYWSISVVTATSDVNGSWNITADQTNADGADGNFDGEICVD